MGSRFLFAFFTLSAVFSLLHPLADGSLTNSRPDPSTRRSRTLLYNPETENSIADPPSEKELPLPSAEESEHRERETPAEAPAEGRKMARHHSTDKSVAGGGVIIGGLFTAIFASVYCYIRVTRRRHPAGALP